MSYQCRTSLVLGKGSFGFSMEVDRVKVAAWRTAREVLNDLHLGGGEKP